MPDWSPRDPWKVHPSTLPGAHRCWLQLKTKAEHDFPPLCSCYKQKNDTGSDSRTNKAFSLSVPKLSESHTACFVAQNKHPKVFHPFPHFTSPLSTQATPIQETMMKKSTAPQWKICGMWVKPAAHLGAYWLVPINPKSQDTGKEQDFLRLCYPITSWPKCQKFLNQSENICHTKQPTSLTVSFRDCGWFCDKNL